MQALVFQGPELITCESGVPDPVIERADDVIVKIVRSGICGSDLHPYHGREAIAAGTIPGHEFVGEVVECGSEVRRLKPGDRVLSPFTTCCGGCFFCEQSLSGRCLEQHVFGYAPPPGVDDGGAGVPGAQAQLIRVPQAEATLMVIPEGVSWEAALLLGDNFSTGFFCADMGEIRPEGITVVLGCGAVGLSAIAAARYLGAERILAVDQVASRRERAESLGATSATPEAAVEIVREWAEPTGQQGADTVLEAVGNPSAQRLAFSLLRPFGVLSAVGMHTSSTFEFSPLDAYNQNLIYKAGRCPARSYMERLVPLVAGGELQVPVEQIVTHGGLGLDRGPEAYERFSQREEGCIKFVLSPWGD